jgi:HSP20 family protein
MNATTHPTETTVSTELAEVVHRPQFRIKETEDGTTVQIALPGVRKENLKLTLLESNLRIEADRNPEIPENWKTHRDPGSIRRYGLDIHLTPRLDGTKTSASLESGILSLRVPVREEAKPRQIEVS